MDSTRTPSRSIHSGSIAPGLRPQCHVGETKSFMKNVLKLEDYFDVDCIKALFAGGCEDQGEEAKAEGGLGRESRADFFYE